MNKKIYWICLGILAMSNQSNSFFEGLGPDGSSEPLLAKKSPHDDSTQEKDVALPACIDETQPVGAELNQLLAVFYHGNPQNFTTLEVNPLKRKELDSILKKHIALLRALYPDKKNKELWKMLVSEPLRPDGETMLHHAAHRLDTYFIEYLLKHGARADQKMETGKLPLDIARNRFFRETQDPQPQIVEEWKPTQILMKRGKRPVVQQSTLVQKVVPPVYNIEKQQALTKRYQATAILLAKATQPKPTLGQKISRVFKR